MVGLKFFSMCGTYLLDKGGAHRCSHWNDVAVGKQSVSAANNDRLRRSLDEQLIASFLSFAGLAAFGRHNHTHRFAVSGEFQGGQGFILHKSTVSTQITKLPSDPAECRVTHNHQQQN